MKKSWATRISTRRVSSTSKRSTGGDELASGKDGIWKRFGTAPALANAISIFVFLATVAGVFLQLGGLRISQKQLDGDIRDMKELARDLEEQRSDFVAEQISQQKAQARIWSSNTEMHGELMKTNDAQNRMIHQIFSAMLVSQDAVALVAGSSGLSDGKKAETMRYSVKLNSSILLLLDFNQKWEAALKQLATESEVAFSRVATAEPLHPDAPEKLRELNKEYAARINVLNGEYTEKLKPFRQSFDSCQSELVSLVISLGEMKSADER